MLLIRIIRDTWLWTSLGVRFLIELTRSSLSVAWAIINPNAKLRPAIIAVPLDLKTDARIAALANMVTLTPGTTSLHVSDDRKILYVHVLDCDDEADVIASIKSSFEDRLKATEAVSP
jgi:multicomponent Na+:H+ antiporter subunit E